MALGLTPYQIIAKNTHPLLVISKDWERIELGLLANVQNGFAFPSDLFNHSEGMPLIRIRDIFSSRTQNLYSGEYNDDFIVRKGDVLIGMDGDFRVSKWPGKIGLLNQRVCRIVVKTDLFDKEFLFICIQPYLDAIHSETSAVTVKHLSSRTISEIPIPLPSLPEQRAIIAKVEELFISLDSGIADLKKAQDQLIIYRQAVLKKAFEGGLTKEWRERKTNLPTADELLKQIKEERKDHYKQEIEDWNKAVKAWKVNGEVGNKPSKPKAVKELPLLTLDELGELPKEPDNWKWCKVDKIAGHKSNSLKAGPFGSSLKKSFYTKTGYKIYGQEQVISGNAYFGNYYVGEEIYLSLTNCAVFPKDILISLVGTVGKVLVLPADSELGIINPRLVKITLNTFYESVFFKYYFESSFLKSLYKVKNHGTTMDVLNLGSIKELPFPLCSIEEQHQIVQEIESRLSVCDKVEESIVESLEKAKALRQSILKKAFEGKLLNHKELAACKSAPDYEPAAVLLERIKAEKATGIKNAPVSRKRIKDEK